ncbi:MAG: acyl-CoA thioesterase [Pseudomonadota bacterium]|nr:acyl-CoA thioesterase [Pseudomonadota bacterium]
MQGTSHDDSHLFPHGRQPTVRVLAMPADTNPGGHIFGGWIMAQMDVAGAIVAIEYARGRVATVAATSMEFHRPVYVGDLISCFARVDHIGTTSITVKVEVFAQRIRQGQGQCVKVTEAVMVYVALDGNGDPRPLPQRDSDELYSQFL